LSVVLDANALVVLALDRWRALAIEKLLRAWKAEGEELHAPVLLRYEVASALAQALSGGQLEPEAVADATQRIDSVPIVLHQPKTRLRSWRWRSVLSAAAPTTRRMSCSPKNSTRSYGRLTDGSLETPSRADCRCSSSRQTDGRIVK
jgi:predicted nucleic acid-binding protein